MVLCVLKLLIHILCGVQFEKVKLKRKTPNTIKSKRGLILFGHNLLNIKNIFCLVNYQLLNYNLFL